MIEAGRHRLAEHPAHSWPSVVQFFRGCARADPYFEPLHQLVARLADSRLAQGLFPVKAMHTIYLYQQDRWSDADDVVRVELQDGEFVVQYFPGASRPRGTGTPAVWARRGTDGFAILEGCLRHLGWFVEYRGVEGETLPASGRLGQG